MRLNSTNTADSSARPFHARYVGLSTRAALVIVAVLGLYAALQAPEATENYGVTFSHAGWTVVILFLVGLTNVGVARFFLLPAAARRQDATPDSLVVMGYTFSGEGWMSLPFSLLSLVAVIDLRLYFARADERAQS
jgi:hypothetical protein